jgi:hypothetical protein
MIGTLILSNSDSMHTFISLIVLYNSCITVIRKYRDPFYLKKYIRIIRFALVLRRAFFNRITKKNQYNTTIKLILLLELIKGPYPALRTPK